MDLKLNVELVHPNAALPKQATRFGAGYELFSPIGHKLVPGERKLIPLGVKVGIPLGLYGRLAPITRLAWKLGIDVLGGVWDADLVEEELGVILINHGTQNFVIKPGDAVAQLIIEAILNPQVELVPSVVAHDQFTETVE